MVRDATTREALFASTRWSVIREASESEASTRLAHDALSELCHIYWRSVYLFLRRNGKSRDDAQDLTQGFFAHLIETRAYANADQAKGRFRSFLLGALKHFLANTRDYGRADKRGGGAILNELDERAISEAEMHAARRDSWSADVIYDREWAAALLRQALERLAQESKLAGKGNLFDELKSHLSAGTESSIPYEQLSLKVGRPIATLRSDVARLRSRYRTILRDEVRGTLVNEGEVDEELKYLCQVLAA